MGVTAPTGLGFATAGAVAAAIGGVTFFQAVKLSIKNPHFLLGNLRVAAMTSAINFLLFSLAFEIGVLIGSVASAIACRRN